MHGSLIVGIVVLAACTYALRMSGTLLGARHEFSNGTEQVFGIGTTTLLVAVAVTAAVFEGNTLDGVARPLGVVAALIAAACRMQIIGVVIIAAVVTAGLRFVGIS
jgi:uncharacterized membrane protein